MDSLVCRSHWVTHIYMRRYSNQHWFRWWLVAWTAPSHYLNQCLSIINWTLRNKFQWNFNQNSSIFIQENAFENFVCEMASILSRRQCVDKMRPRCRLLFVSGFWKSITIEYLVDFLGEPITPGDRYWNATAIGTAFRILICTYVFAKLGRN